MTIPTKSRIIEAIVGCRPLSRALLVTAVLLLTAIPMQCTSTNRRDTETRPAIPAEQFRAPAASTPHPQRRLTPCAAPIQYPLIRDFAQNK